ncbi:MAG: carboxypeptidase regulatory-like domain-containing protein, partial [Bacteroidota bacterium]|nr:carboxypeptidase regulatory-like domain-containing protein [Bacteroidota bacterium]
MKRIITCCFFFVQLSILHAQSGSIRGMIQTSDDKPVAGMILQLNDPSATCLSDSSGRYQFTGLAAGNYTLLVLSGSMERMERKISLRNQENRICDFRIPVKFSALQDVAVYAVRTQNERHITIGKSGIQSRDLPQSLVVIDHNLLEKQQVQQMSDVLKNTNGV